MNRVPVIVWNPAYIEELEPRDSLDLISGESQIITAPASDDGATAEGVVDEPDDGGSAEEAEVDVKQVLQEAVQSMSSLNEELRSMLSLNRDQTAVQLISIHMIQGRPLRKSIGCSPIRPGRI